VYHADIAPCMCRYAGLWFHNVPCVCSSAMRTTTGGGAPSSAPGRPPSTSSHTPSGTSCVAIFTIQSFYSACENRSSRLTSGCRLSASWGWHRYFVSKLDIKHGVSIFIYFTYMGMISIAFFLLTGSIGFFACLWFVRKIYGAIKVRSIVSTRAARKFRHREDVDAAAYTWSCAYCVFRWIERVAVNGSSVLWQEAWDIGGPSPRVRLGNQAVPFL
jgi:hypothetical protein